MRGWLQGGVWGEEEVEHGGVMVGDGLRALGRE